MDAFERRTPHYLRIYRDLKNQISESEYAPSERLPTQLELGEPVFSIERLRFVGLEPVVYQHSQLLPWLGEALDDVDLSIISLYDYLQRELNVELAHAQERVHAIPLAAHEATLLEEEPGAAALLSERVTFSVTGDPIMFDRAFMPGDRVSIATDRFVSDVTVGYELRLDQEDE